MWSFVGDKGNQRASLPSVYRQCAKAYTDFWSAYAVALPEKRHQVKGKHSGKTSDIEHFNPNQKFYA
jgi:IS1 family transposase